LSEEQAKKVIKDLILLDGYKAINSRQEKRIANLSLSNSTYEKLVANKDEIINVKDEIIARQEKIMNLKKKFEFHTYAGAKTYNVDFRYPIFYGRSQLEFKSTNVGVMVNFFPVAPEIALQGFNYNLYIEFKLF
jgi:hypothetical protein